LFLLNLFCMPIITQERIENFWLLCPLIYVNTYLDPYSESEIPTNGLPSNIFDVYTKTSILYRVNIHQQFWFSSCYFMESCTICSERGQQKIGRDTRFQNNNQYWSSRTNIYRLIGCQGTNPRDCYHYQFIQLCSYMYLFNSKEKKQSISTHYHMRWLRRNCTSFNAVLKRLSLQIA